jgi:hypothetical protein
MSTNHIRLGQPTLYFDTPEYIPLVRHSSQAYPNYQSAWEDKYPASWQDKYCENNLKTNQKFKIIKDI